MKKEMVDKEESLSIVKQCEILDIPRGRLYYKQVELSEKDLDILSKLDEIYTEDPSYGTRRMKMTLKKVHGVKIGRRKLKTLMGILNISAIYPKKNLSQPNLAHHKYPYLLRNVPITRVNQVWSTDITYIKLKKGFVYLTAVIDWYSRFVLSWKLSTTLDRQFCIDVVKEALTKYGQPDIFNTDQGSQYTSSEFIEILKEKDIKISMDGKGRALDNIFVERLWRTVKYEDVYLKGYENVKECKKGLEKYFDKYNNRRLHQSLEYNYPTDIYLGKVSLAA